MKVITRDIGDLKLDRDYNNIPNIVYKCNLLYMNKSITQVCYVINIFVVMSSDSG